MNRNGFRHKKTQNYTLRLSSVLIALLFIVSCSQEEGIGGRCSINGIISEKVYSEDFKNLQSEDLAKDIDIFLLFGDETVIGEKTTSSFTGEFEFRHLWPGNYKLYYYSENPGGKNGELEEVILDISLSKGESKDLGGLTLNRTIDIDEGNSEIKGKVILTNYKNGSEWPTLVVKDVSPAQEKEVYLVYGDHKQYDERIRTNYDGTFSFVNLIKGEYLIYVFSEDIRGGTENVVIKKEVTITKDNQVMNLGEFHIDKL